MIKMLFIQLFVITITLIITCNSNVTTKLYRFDKMDVISSTWSYKILKTNILSHIACTSQCISRFGCSAFYYNKETKECQLGSKTSLTVATVSNSPNQILTIFINPEDPWIMILGGYIPGLISTVELYNWQTEQICYLPSMPYGAASLTGSFFDGNPLFCGGESPYGYEQRCWVYDREIQQWNQIASLPGSSKFSRSFVVPNEGYFIYGGTGGKNMHQLSSLNGTWGVGPALFRSQSINSVCIVQLDDFTTLFFGGSVNNKQIAKFDWKTKTYTAGATPLIRNRMYSVCDLIHKKNGPMMVAIAGGNDPTSMGIELYNPQDDSVQLIVDKLPQEVGPSVALYRGWMVSINNNTQLVFLEGVAGTLIKDIWVYNYEKNSFETYGKTLIGRNELMAMPVKGLECPW